MMKDDCDSRCEACKVECNFKKRKEEISSMILPESSFSYMDIKSFKASDEVLIVGKNCFAKSTIKHVFFNKILIIMENAFESCEGLEDLNMPEVQVIKRGAFKDCRNLKSVGLFSSKLIEVSPWAFENCQALTDIWFEGTDEAWCKATNKQGILWGCKTSLQIHCSNGIIVNSITLKANDDDYLEQVNTTLEELHLEYEYDQIKGVGPGVCANMKFLKEFKAGEGFECLGKNSFCHCINLEKAILPASLISLEEGVFSGCDKLSTIIFKGNMEKFQKLIEGKDWIDHNVEVFCDDGIFSYER